MKIISPDWAAIRSRLEEWSRALVAGSPEVLGVLLFGSLARDDHAPGSDADLIVVLRSSGLAPPDRAAGLLRLSAGIPTDITVYTAAELKRFLSAENPFVHRALREGCWLACRDGWTPPAAP